MAKVSVIIPSRCEFLEVEPGVSVLQRTVADVFEKASGDIEVIVVEDGQPFQHLPNYPNLVQVNMFQSGTKVAINRGAAIATGEYLLKLDSHCMVGEGFDEILQADMEDNWIVTPRFYVLDAERWAWQDERFYDYFFLPCPLVDKHGFRFQAGGHWKDRTAERLDTPIDENMKLHGSCFFVKKDFYWGCLSGLDPRNGAGTWNGEDIELSLKTWLGPWVGKLMVNKKTWYAHMHRGGQRPREWPVDYREARRSAEWSAKYWMANSWEERAHDLEWLVERFSPVPGWVENWRELYEKWKFSQPA